MLASLRPALVFAKKTKRAAQQKRIHELERELARERGRHPEPPQPTPSSPGPNVPDWLRVLASRLSGRQAAIVIVLYFTGDLVVTQLPKAMEPYLKDRPEAGVLIYLPFVGVAGLLYLLREALRRM